MDPYGPTGTIKLSCIGFHLRDDHWGLNLRGLRMKFHKNVTMFDFAGIPIVANYDNGIIIGLTAAGAEICRKLLVEDLDGGADRKLDRPAVQLSVRTPMSS